MGSTNIEIERCPDCGRQLHRVWDYPANELWCVHCGNRYFASLRPSASPSADAGDDEARVPEPSIGLRVLLLDESSGRRERLVRHFTRLGYQVTPVGHPRQALEAASFRRFDLVVLPAEISEFDCAGLVCKLKRLLGNLKFIVVVDNDRAILDALDDSVVVCASAGGTDNGEPERTLEQLACELAAGRQRLRGLMSDLEEVFV
jgi:CheY-like chemotaxis protein